MRTLGVLVAVLLAGSTASCGNLLGLDDPRLTDAGTDPIDAPIDAPPDTVTGRMYLRLSTATGVREAPTDASAITIRALIPDPGSSGYRAVTGVGRADGTFSISGVPPGVTYLLSLGTRYYVTAARTIDQHFDLPGRNDAIAATMATPVTFDLARMTAFDGGADGQTFDSVEVDSFNIGYIASLDVAHRAQTARATLDWRDGFNTTFSTGPALPAGDDLHVLHLRDEPFTIAGGRRPRVTRILDWYDGGNVTFANGVPATVTDGFTGVAADRSFAVQNLQRGAYDASYNGTAERQSLQLALTASPVATDFGTGATVLSLDFNDWSRSSTTSVNTTIAYGDPFPSGWSRLFVENYQVFRWLRLPGTVNPRINLGGTVRTRLATPGAPSLAPTLAPPAAPKVGGLDVTLGGKLRLEGVVPVTATWGAVAGARIYRVNVLRLFSNGTQTRSQLVASLVTADTTLTIPAEVFSGSEFFSFTIAAIQAPADYGAGMLEPNGLPSSRATVPGGVFRMSPSCGDGMIQMGEDCDASGETAMCDVDCSTRLCGDGLRNAAAGEACDTVRDTPSCDSDCTLPVCGDGRVNPQLEDCDDGNATADGNGCSAECKFNNICGNNVREALAEQCDTAGNTATCDADCTTVLCGDGLVNPLANEQCDQGPFNGNGTSGCPATCILP